MCKARRIHVVLDESASDQLVRLQESGRNSVSRVVRRCLATCAVIRKQAAAGYSELRVHNPQTGRSKTVEIVCS